MNRTGPNSVGTIVPVILAGGVGSRLWPLSRDSYPKQFLPLMSERSLVQETLLRYADRRCFAAPIIVTNEATRFILAEQAQAVGQSDAMMILEPMARGTAPAIALAALLAVERDQEAILVVAPSDHVIGDIKAFRDGLDVALSAAQAAYLVTFAIIPQRAETGYGYIRCGAPLAGLGNAYRVDGFVEKPDMETAEKMIEEGAYFWNSGMFVFRAQSYLDELLRLAPEIAVAAQKSLARRSIDRLSGDLIFLRPDAEAFARSPSTSIDYAVMEHTRHACAVMLDAGWSDIGSWLELWCVAEHDAAGNVLRGDVLMHDSHDCLVIGERAQTTLIGVNNLAVITTDDAVLVAALDQVQAVRAIAAQLSQGARSEVSRHRQKRHPWGSSRLLQADKDFHVRQVTLTPGASQSMQRHRQSSKHWVVIGGIARVMHGDEVTDLKPGQSMTIAVDVLHRLENPNRELLNLIEVQSGTELEDDDVEALDVSYRRD